VTLATSPRFTSKVSKQPNGCWLWTGAKNDGGYGQLRTNGLTQYAHRLAYETFVGPIPDRLQIDHLCRTRLCVNPAHLEAVTQRENIMRGVSPTVAHAAKTHCINGHPFDEENTYIRPDKGTRQCKRCSYLRFRDAQRRKRTAVA